MDIVGVYKINSAKAWLNCQSAFIKMGYKWRGSGSNTWLYSETINESTPKFIIVQKECKSLYYRCSENQLGDNLEQCKALKEMIVEWVD